MRVTNLVYTTKIGDLVDLEVIDACVPEARFEPDRFRGVVLKLGGTCLIFHNGATVIVGVKSENEAIETMNELIDMLNGLGLEVRAGNLQLRNIVGYHDYGVRVCQANLYKTIRQLDDYKKSSFEPEISPGLVIKSTYTAVVFHNGKVIFTGIKNFEDLNMAYEKVGAFIENSIPTST